MEEEIFMTEEEYASQAGTGKLLNPRIDSTFKAMFTQNTPESKSALKFLLEAATDGSRQICEEGIMQAQKSLSSISENRSVWIAQYRQEIYERDRISGLEAARNEGREAGLKEGQFSTYADLVKSGLISVETAVARLGMTREVFQAMLDNKA